ncbi:RbsD/FucU domain-containing protein [Glycomyces dulcitolivorans]|uniref:RbsD/FucU domain-containing protein n=1 Tax=Glycomyces dulcitolivorans TaxID=2200759 RepID=UPI000DD36663|nr:RbsD/FucU domain-containing protein [Glycomyces dulcitolivorans]
MLTTELIHPPILAALAAAGHGSRVLIADGNYPAATARNPLAALVHLNLRPGVLTVDEILDPLLTAVVIESAAVMSPPDRRPVAAHAGFQAAMPGVEIVQLDREPFYAESRGGDVALVIASGDRRAYANLLLTIGVTPQL